MVAPYNPQNVVLQSGNEQNYLTWNFAIGATSYSISRSTDGINFSVLGTSSTNNYLDSVVTVGTAYYYKVASVNASGVSAYSASYPPSIVPCLPGQINLGYLRYLAQLRSDKLNSQYLTTDEWNNNINQSIGTLRDILVTNYGEDYFFAPPLIIPLIGLDYYPLPNGSNYLNATTGLFAPAIYKLNGVDANISGANLGPNAGWVPLARFNWSDRDKYTTFPGQAGALNNIYEAAYRVMGSNLHIIPANTNLSIRLWYVPIDSLLLQDTDMLTYAYTGWHEFVINDVAMKAMIKEESLEKWNALNGANQAIIARIEASAVNRDVGQPNSVSNVRSAMGDPGFSGWGSGGAGGFSSGWGGM